MNPTEIKEKIIESMISVATNLSLDCGDNSCIFADRENRGGMRTNGGCRCIENIKGLNRIYVQKIVKLAIILAKHDLDNKKVSS